MVGYNPYAGAYFDVIIAPYCNQVNNASQTLSKEILTTLYGIDSLLSYNALNIVDLLLQDGAGA